MKLINLLTGFILMFVPRSLTCSCLAKLKIFSDECDYQYISEDMVVIKNRQRVVRNSDFFNPSQPAFKRSFRGIGIPFADCQKASCSKSSATEGSCTYAHFKNKVQTTEGSEKFEEQRKEGSILIINANQGLQPH